MKRADWAVPAILASSILLFLVNFMMPQSSIIPIVASILFLGGSSSALGKLVYARENMIFRIFFGVTTILVILGLIGTGLTLLASFNETLSLISLIAIASSIAVALVVTRKKRTTEVSEPAILKKKGEKNGRLSLLLIFPFIFLVVFAFILLFSSRTGEGGSSVWLAIPSFFIVVYLAAALSLVALLFFTDLHLGIKLASVCAFSFLSHSLFLLVWYPGRYGDPWTHLGEARYIARAGMPYAYSHILQNSLWLDLIKSRAFYSLIVFFNRMFSVDIYWVFIISIPLLWSVFSPLLAYKIAETLEVRKSKTFPLVAAIATLIFPSLVIWGAVSVANSFGFIFLFVSLTLLLLWTKQGGSQIWLMAFLAAAVSFFGHPQAGLFAFMFLFFGTIAKKTSRKLFLIAGFLLMLLPYPLALYIEKASFNLSGLVQIGNFIAFQSEIFTFLFVFALVGIILGIRGRFVDSKVTYLFFVFYLVVLFEFYLTQYGMINLPYDAGRVLVASDFLLAVLVPLGFLTLISPLRKALSNGKKNVLSSLSLVKINVKVNPRVIGLVLISLFLSVQATAMLYQAYPQSEIQSIQPAAYEIEAIRYINSDTTAQYVVLSDPSIAALAAGFLGADYSYGTYGAADWSYPTMQMYLGMTQQPSISYMTEAMSFTGALVSYFIVSVRTPYFEQVVNRTSEILPVNQVFGDGKLYIFKYPTTFVQKTGPQVNVTFDDGKQSAMVQTQLSYLVESEVNATLNLWGHTSYNVSEFPPNWAFVGLTINNKPGQFDNSSDVNTFIYTKGLQPGDHLTVNWLFYPKYPNVGWKENSFKRDWHPSTIYSGIPGKPPSFTVNGSVLRLSYSFEPGSYWYSYYVTSVGTSTNDYPYLIVRWRCNLPAGLVYAYFDDGSGQQIVSFGSQSLDWATTIIELKSGTVVSSLMVGLTNGANQQLSGNGTLEIGFILIVG